MAWIETARVAGAGLNHLVATREGGVDRNIQRGKQNHAHSVATREGGVDRNRWSANRCKYYWHVATREGGVDRNLTQIAKEQDVEESPPARVAWIETPNREEN